MNSGIFVGAGEGGAPDVVKLWQDTFKAAPAEVRAGVAGLVEQVAPEVINLFYVHMLAHPRARDYLQLDLVETRLKGSLLSWMESIFTARDEASLPALAARQVQIGLVHARIKLPSDLMQRGVRLIAAELRARLPAVFPDIKMQLAAVVYIHEVLQVADMLIMSAFVRNIQDHVRKEEAYRVVSLEHDMALERERQRALLAEWGHQQLLATRLPSRVMAAGTLAESDFGSWLRHKAVIFFDGANELESVWDVVREIDEVVIPQLVAEDVVGPRAEKLILDLERWLEFIRYLLNDLFSRLGSALLGRDSVTRLLNRRYLPALLTREIDTHKGSGDPLCVLLIKVDPASHNPAFADPESHARMLQQMSMLIVDATRGGDHVFRYGDDTFLIIAVNASAGHARDMAEEIRARVQTTDFRLLRSHSNRVTVSVAVANFNGHPDYQMLLSRLEDATMRLTIGGGNKVGSA